MNLLDLTYGRARGARGTLSQKDLNKLTRQALEEMWQSRFDHSSFCTKNQDEGSGTILTNNQIDDKWPPDREASSSLASDDTLGSSPRYCINTEGRFTEKLVLTELQVSYCWGWHGSTDFPISTGRRAREGWGVVVEKWGREGRN